MLNSILTAAYEFETDVCAHALSCNARLSVMVLQWPDAKLAVLLFTLLPHACKNSV